MTPARVLRASVLAGLCAALIGTSAYTDYAGLRVRVLKEPVAAGLHGVRVALTPEKLAGLGPPFAVIASLRNDSPSATSIVIRLDDKDVCTPMLAAGQTRRVDCQFNGEWNPAVAHTASFVSTSASWGVDAFELSRHHGSNASLVRLFVLPAGSQQFLTPGIVACSLRWLLLTALILVSPPTLPKPLRIAHRRGAASAIFSHIFVLHLFS